MKLGEAKPKVTLIPVLIDSKQYQETLAEIAGILYQYSCQLEVKKKSKILSTGAANTTTSIKLGGLSNG